MRVGGIGRVCCMVDSVGVLGDGAMGSLTVDGGAWVCVGGRGSVWMGMASHRIARGQYGISRGPGEKGLLEVCSKAGRLLRGLRLRLVAYV